MQTVKRIVILGPESTGKSTLCRELAGYYGSEWVPEYARAYLMEHGMNYTYDDLLTIAKGQLRCEEEKDLELHESSPVYPFLFYDTNMYVMQVWCEFVFDRCHSWILEKIAERRYDLYLLCNIDLPWTKDQLREYPDFESRERLYHIYKEILINQHVPWVLVSGDDKSRLQAAVHGINECFKLPDPGSLPQNTFERK
jgi:NadR type nicotinamide-nucleotide adenylyltransferase